MSSMRLLAVLLAFVAFSPEPVAHAGLFGGSRAKATAAAPNAVAAPKRGLAVRLKASWRKLGKVGQGATLLATGAAAAFGMHHLGMSPQETAATIGSVAAVGTGTIAILAARAKAMWTRSTGALKLAEVDRALESRQIGGVPTLISSIKTAIAQAHAGGDKPKEQARQAAFLGLALVRAELALNEAPDAGQRLAGVTLEGWTARLGTLDQRAAKQVTATSEGQLAHALHALDAEMISERAVVARHADALTHFEDQVPLGFGGAMAQQAKRARTLAAKMSDEEVGGEVALHDKLNTAMRGRVSDRLAGEQPEFLRRRTRQRNLNSLRGGPLRDALHLADHASRELSSAASDLDSATSLELQAASHTKDTEYYTETEYYTDDQGAQQWRSVTKTRTVDNSQQYRQLAASHASSAASHVDNANTAMRNLSTELKGLGSHPTLVAEGLIVKDHRASAAQAGPGWFEQLFMPAALNVFQTLSARSSVSSAQSHMEKKLNALRSLDAEVERRESGEAHWVGEQINVDVSRQMAAVSP